MLRYSSTFSIGTIITMDRCNERNRTHEHTNFNAIHRFVFGFDCFFYENLNRFLSVDVNSTQYNRKLNDYCICIIFIQFAVLQKSHYDYSAHTKYVIQQSTHRQQTTIISQCLRSAYTIDMCFGSPAPHCNYLFLFRFRAAFRCSRCNLHRPQSAGNNNNRSIDTHFCLESRLFSHSPFDFLTFSLIRSRTWNGFGGQ